MATRNSSRSGGNRPRTHPIRSVKSTKIRRPPITPTRPARTKPRILAAIDFVIEDQRGSLRIAISLLYCLHSALRREIEAGRLEESEAVKDAAEWADLTEISAALLVRLGDIHTALDSVSLKRADVDPKRVMLAEAVRKLQIGRNEDSRP